MVLLHIKHSEGSRHMLVCRTTLENQRSADRWGHPSRAVKCSRQASWSRPVERRYSVRMTRLSFLSRWGKMVICSSVDPYFSTHECQQYLSLQSFLACSNATRPVLSWNVSFLHGHRSTMPARSPSLHVRLVGFRLDCSVEKALRGWIFRHFEHARHFRSSKSVSSRHRAVPKLSLSR